MNKSAENGSAHARGPKFVGSLFDRKSVTNSDLVVEEWTKKLFYFCSLPAEGGDIIKKKWPFL